MTPQEAGQVVAVLNAGFPRDALERESVVLFVNEVALLADASVGLEAARQIVREGEKFPTLKEIRVVYRAVAERRAAEERAARAQLPEGERQPVPEWVHVWWWGRGRANGRPFPQEEPDAPNRLTDDEYDALRGEWEKAGGPKLGSPAALAGSVVLDGQD